MALEEEELLLKQLPHSVEAEQAVLGSMLIDPRCVPGCDRAAPAGGLLSPAEPGDLRDHLLHVQLLPHHRPGDGAGEHAAKRGLRRECLPQLHPPAHGHHAHRGQREGVRGHHQGQDPAAAHRRDGGGPDRHGPAGHRHRPGRAGGGRAADLRHPPGPGRPGTDTHLRGAAGCV